jgi:hypothetical protein
MKKGTRITHLPAIAEALAAAGKFVIIFLKK